MPKVRKEVRKLSRPIHKLSAKRVDTIKSIAEDPVNGKRRVSDGGGLWLNVVGNGSKSWIFRWTPKGGSAREMGLGPYPDLSLSDARRLAEIGRGHVANGKDPKRERDAERVVPLTFGEVADKYLETRSDRWTNAKTKWQWEDSLIKRCAPIRNRPVTEIELPDVLSILNPIWKKTPETGSRVQMRMEAVLNFAKTMKYRTGENPAAWKNHLDQVLKKRKKEDKKHHPAMPYTGLPVFLVRLRRVEALAGRALELTILTACRTSEALWAEWTEFDLDNAIWEIPKERMKMKIAHRIPLSTHALVLLKALENSRHSKYVFPGQKPGKPLSNMSMEMLLRRMKIENATVHGFRSSFRDWAGDKTNHPREVAEAALAHKVGDDTENAYRRSDALEKRRHLMSAWANYCAGDETSNVVQLHG